MRLLLVSTYELGRQPVHVASPAASLRRDGHEVDTVDLAVQDLDMKVFAGVDAVAFSVPMHTAMRLAITAASRVRKEHPDLPIAFYGLYAAVGAGGTVGDVADVVIAGEYEDDLRRWAGSLSTGEPARSGVVVEIGNTDIGVPDRTSLPSLDDYARLEWNGLTRRAAAVEASHGCRHRCRHCPIPALYDGRMRITGADVVLSDIDQLVSAGVEHVTFGDPDFLNAPRYSLDLLRDAHSAHPGLTFDVTVKVEHILDHRDLWDEMAGLGVLFVVSAFESVDDHTLEILDKGHTMADMGEAVRIMGGAGVHLRPTWLPFMPWTTPGHVKDLAGFIDEHTLWAATDPVQLAIRLLIPEGSLVEDHPAVVPYLTSYDPMSLTWRWRFEDPQTELLQKELEAIAASASDCGEEAVVTLAAMRDVIGNVTGTEFPALREDVEPVPRLSESWFCCAEPTADQASAVGLGITRP